MVLVSQLGLLLVRFFLQTLLAAKNNKASFPPIILQGPTLRFGLRPTRRHLMLAAIGFLTLSLSLAAAMRNVNAQQFSMPEEQVNYTITQIDGVMWAKIDGAYPITYTGNETSIPMVYPTPPGTTNISVWMNDGKLSWSNFTEANPDALHHTAIGDWSEILTVLENVSGGFVLRIHYEHPLQVINGSCVFLYDLNIQEYLSALDNSSVAHFTITMDTNYTNLKVSNVDPETETLKPIAFTVSDGNPAQIKVDEVSEFGKPLPGDLLVSFSKPIASNDNLLRTVVLAVVIALMVAGLAAYILILVRKQRNQQSRWTILNTAILVGKTSDVSESSKKNRAPKKKGERRDKVLLWA